MNKQKRLDLRKARQYARAMKNYSLKMLMRKDQYVMSPHYQAALDKEIIRRAQIRQAEIRTAFNTQKIELVPYKVDVQTPIVTKDDATNFFASNIPSVAAAIKYTEGIKTMLKRMGKNPDEIIPFLREHEREIREREKLYDPANGKEWYQLINIIVDEYMPDQSEDQKVIDSVAEFSAGFGYDNFNWGV